MPPKMQEKAPKIPNFSGGACSRPPSQQGMPAARAAAYGTRESFSRGPHLKILDSATGNSNFSPAAIEVVHATTH